MTEDTTKPLNKVIRIDESEIRGHLDEMGMGKRALPLVGSSDPGRRPWAVPEPGVYAEHRVLHRNRRCAHD